MAVSVVIQVRIVYCSHSQRLVSGLFYDEVLGFHSEFSTYIASCVSLAESMESGVCNSITRLTFTSKTVITKHVWYSFQSKCLLLNVDIEF